MGADEDRTHVIRAGDSPVEPACLDRASSNYVTEQPTHCSFRSARPSRMRYLVVEGQRIIEANTAASLILGCQRDAALDLHHLMSAFRRLIERAPHRLKLGPLSWIVIWNRTMRRSS